MTSGFWSGKCVLLTAHTGFKGAWLSLYLEALGAKVTGLALAPDQNPNLFEVAGIDQGMHSIIGDIRDLPKVEHVGGRGPGGFCHSHGRAGAGPPRLSRAGRDLRHERAWNGACARRGAAA